MHAVCADCRVSPITGHSWCFTERKNRKHARLFFTCQGKGEHCLYAKTFFTMRTRQPRLWVHLMFLALQVS